MTWSTIDLASPPVWVGKASCDAITKLQMMLELTSGEAIIELQAKLKFASDEAIS